MNEKGRRGISGRMQVKVAFEHKGQGKTYAVGDIVEGMLVNYRGRVVFEFSDDDKPEWIDPEKINPANFDRSCGIFCLLSFRYYLDKGSYVEGKLLAHDGGVYFLIDDEFVPLHHLRGDVDTMDCEGGLGYEIKDIPRFFNALG
jgi:hypothetical protein